MRFTNYVDAEDRAENEQKIIELYKKLKNDIYYVLDNNLDTKLIKDYIKQFEKELEQRGCIEKNKMEV